MLVKMTRLRFVAAFENVRNSHFTGSVTSVTVDTAMP